TNRSLRRMLNENGFQVLRMDAVTKELQDTEFSYFTPEALPAGLREDLLALPDAKTYQFIVEAIAGTGPDLDLDAGQPPSASIPAWNFTSHLRWRGGNEPFIPTAVATCLGTIGMEAQTLTFHLPDSAEEIAQLRLDLADRPGYMRLYTMTL